MQLRELHGIIMWEDKELVKVDLTNFTNLDFEELNEASGKASWWFRDGYDAKNILGFLNDRLPEDHQQSLPLFENTFGAKLTAENFIAFSYGKEMDNCWIKLKHGPQSWSEFKDYCNLSEEEKKNRYDRTGWLVE